MKTNDWIVANLSNPDLTPQDFHDALGMSQDNTQLLSEDDYLKSDFITNNPNFKGQDGQFNKQIFDKYYQQTAQTYSSFDDSNNNALSNFKFDPFDTAAKASSRIKPVSLHFEEVLNPDKQSIGISGINQKGDVKQTPMEIAQTQKIFDGAKFLDETPNDSALIQSGKSIIKSTANWMSSLFENPLVMATYDEDTDAIDPLTGRKEHHKKGEYKLNDEGTYYLEKLNGRSIVGKQVMSHFDTITVDNEGANAIDFFDSDSADKSITGTILKSAVTVAPLFLSPEIASIYSGLLVAKELVKILPDLSNIAGGLIGDTNLKSPLLNNLAGAASSYTQGVSQNSQQHELTFENMGNMISDVALIWGQQKAIGESLEKLSGVQKTIDTAKAEAKAAYDADKLAMTENYATKEAQLTGEIKANPALTDEQIAEKQATLNNEKEQALNPFGSDDAWDESPIGQDYINKYTPQVAKKIASVQNMGADAGLAYMSITANTEVYNQLKEKGASDRAAASVALGSMIGMFSVDKFLGIGRIFTKNPSALNDTKDALTESCKNVTDVLNAGQDMESSSMAGNWFIKGFKKGKSIAEDFVQKMQDQNLTSDLGKAVAGGLERMSEQLAADASKQIYEWGGDLNLWDKHNSGAFDNLTARYGMSFLTGVIGSGIFSAADRLKGIKPVIDSTNKELMYQVSQGRTDAALDELDKLHDAGKCGSTTLSATKKTDDGVWLTATNPNDSQNTFVYKQLKNVILQLDGIINQGVKLGKTKEELVMQMLMGQTRYNGLKDYLNGAAYETGYVNDYMQALNKYTNIAAMVNTVDTYTLDGTKFNIAQDENGNYTIDTPTDEQQRHATEEQKKAKQATIDNLKQDKAKILQSLQDFQSGKSSIPYVRKMQFLLDKRIYEPFLSQTFDEYVKDKTSKNVDDLSVAEQHQYKEEYDNYAKTLLKDQKDAAFNIYKTVESKIIPVLETIPKDFNSEEIKSILNYTVDYTQRLPEETDEQYNGRDLLDENQKAIRTNTLLYNNLLRKLSLSQGIDGNTQRILYSSINVRQKEIRDNITKFLLSKNPIDLTHILQKDIENNQINIQELPLFNQAIEKSIKEYDGSESSRQAVLNTVRAKLSELYGGTIGKTLSSREFREIFSIVDFPATIDDIDNILPEDFGKNDENIQYVWDKLKQNSDATYENQPTIQDAIKNELSDSFSEISKKLDEIDSTLQNDIVYKTLTTINDKVSKTNAASILLKNFAVKLGDKDVDVENILSTIFKNYSTIDNLGEFILSNTGVSYDDLDKLEKYIDYVSTYVVSASTQPNLFSPYGHNWAINDLINTHQDVLSGEQVLPVIDQSIANTYLFDLARYKTEIGVWKQLSQKNEINKEQQHIQTSKAVINAHIDNINMLIKNLKFDINGQSIDLAEGVDTATDRPSLMVAEQTIYNNFAKSGLKLSDLLYTGSPIYNLVYDSKNELLPDFKLQKTSKLDPSLKDLTPYDRLIHFLTVLTESPQDFYSFQKMFISQTKNIAPLTAQQEIERIIIGRINGGEEYRKILEKLSPGILTSLDCISFIDALGGAGKSSVVAKAISKYFDNGETLLITPEQTQLDSLKKSTEIPDGQIKDVFFKALLGNNYDDFIADKSNAFNVEHREGRDEEVANDNLKLNELEHTPKLIIIDEITHFNARELQALNLYAKNKGIEVITLGNTNQNGADHNIELSDEFFTLRAPKLTVSLRDNNVQKQGNERVIASLQENVLNFNTIYDANNILSNIDDTLSKTHLKVYNGSDDINGDLITDDISPDVINKLSGTVGYVGDPNNAYVKYLKANTKITNIQMLTPDAIQGQEFDYVIVDQPLAQTLRENLNNANQALRYKEGLKLTSYYKFLKNLYTMVTRSTTATIFKDNGLSTIIGNNSVDAYKNKNDNSVLQKAIDNFSVTENEFINQVLDILPSNEPNTVTAQQPEVEPQPDPVTAQQSEEPVKLILPEVEPQPDPVRDNTLVDTTPEREELPTQAAIFTDVNLKRVQTTQDLGLSTNTISTIESVLINNTISADYFKDLENTDDSKIYVKLLIQILQKTSKSLYNSNIVASLQKSLVLNDDKFISAMYDLGFQNNISIKNAIRNAYYHLKRENPSVWTKTINNDLYEDLNIVMDKDTTNSPEDKKRYVQQLMDIKSSFLYQKNLNDFNDIHYYLEVRKQSDIDTFYGFTGLKEDKLSLNVNGKRDYMYLIKAEYTDINNRKCSVTLGGMQAPEVHNDLKYNQYLSSLKNKADKNNGYYKQDVTDTLSFSKYTNMDKNNSVKVTTLTDFMKYNPYTVVSDIFINCEKGANTVGRAVVFATRDTSVKPDELRELYQVQQSIPNSNKTVRMIVLNNLGLSLYEISNYQPLFTDDYGKEYKTNITSKNMPMEASYMGKRMLPAMWNFRANLYNFTNKYDAYFGQDNIDINGTQIPNTFKDHPERVALVSKFINAQAILNGNYSDDYKQKVADDISTIAPTQDEMNIVTNFNSQILRNEHAFRLVNTIKGNSVIMKADTDNENEPFVIGIDYDTAQDYKTKLDKTFGILRDNNIITIINNSTNQELDKEQLILASNKENVSFQVLDVGKFTIKIGQDDTEIELKSANYSMKYIPIILSGLNSRMHLNNISYKDADGHYVNLSKLTHADNLLSPTELLNYGKMNDLMFHGTTQNFHQNYEGTLRNAKSSKVLQASGALFKKGFFVDPLAEKDTTSDQFFQKCYNLNADNFSVDVNIGFPYLHLDYNNPVTTPIIKTEEVKQVSQYDLQYGKHDNLTKLAQSINNGIFTNSEGDQVDWNDVYYDNGIKLIDKLKQDNVDLPKNVSISDIWDNTITLTDGKDGVWQIGVTVNSRTGELFNKATPLVSTNAKLASNIVESINESIEAVNEYADGLNINFSINSPLLENGKLKLINEDTDFEQFRDSYIKDIANQDIEDEIRETVNALTDKVYNPKTC